MSTAMATISSEGLSPLGDGPVATVYSGLHAGVPVALKVFPAKFDKRTKTAFGREQAALANLREVSSILPVAGLDDFPDGRHVLRMELCAQSLATLVGGFGPLLPADVVVLGQAVALALAAAHGAGIVHGGVTPHNVLFRGSGEPVIADFGVTLRHAFPRDPLHAIEFLPPETLRGGTLDDRTDLYGLGAVLHFTLTGRSPHPGKLGEQPGERVLRVLGEPVPAINRPGVPIALATLVARLLAVDPAHRPPDAGAVAQQLTSMLPAAPASASVSTWEPAPEPPPRPTPVVVRPVIHPPAPPPPPLAPPAPAPLAAPSPPPLAASAPAPFAASAQDADESDEFDDFAFPSTVDTPEPVATAPVIWPSHQDDDEPPPQAPPAPTALSDMDDSDEFDDFAGPAPSRAAVPKPAMVDPLTGLFTTDFSTPYTDFAPPPREPPPQPKVVYPRAPHNGVATPDSPFASPHSDFTVPHSDFASPNGDFTVPHGDFASPHSDFARPRADLAAPQIDFAPQPAHADFAPPTAAKQPAAVEPLWRRRRYDLLAGAAVLLAFAAVAMVLLMTEDPKELTTTARPQVSSGPTAGGTGPDAAGVQLELAAPTDRGDQVELSWRSTRNLDFAVVVAAEGEPTRVLLAQRNRTMTVPVDPARKYCFLVQATDGTQVFESMPVPVRGAVCRN
ncbi:serine/threonine protein kinase [Actinokineospora sp.]|uniref:serine/threonine protein kinase n=1 Tax=Actinokineospora sp. TaxID=1872133 RepID=UPI004037FDB3